MIFRLLDAREAAAHRAHHSGDAEHPGIGEAIASCRAARRLRPDFEEARRNLWLARRKRDASRLRLSN
jgi:hypothetical protein